MSTIAGLDGADVRLGMTSIPLHIAKTNSFNAGVNSRQSTIASILQRFATTERSGTLILSYTTHSGREELRHAFTYIAVGKTKSRKADVQDVLEVREVRAVCLRTDPGCVGRRTDQA